MKSYRSLLVILLLYPFQVSANTHYLNLSLTGSARHTTNAGNSIYYKDSLFYSSIRPDLTYIYNQERLSYNAHVYANSYMHEGRNELNYSNYGLTNQIKHSFETSKLELSGTLREETTREPSLTEIERPDFKPTRTTNVSANYSKQLSQKMLLQSNVSTSDKSYDSDRYSDYKNSSVSVTLNRSTSETSAFQINFYSSQFDSENVRSFKLTSAPSNENDIEVSQRSSNESRGYGLSLGFKGAWQSYLNYNFLIGGRTNKSAQGNSVSYSDPSLNFEDNSSSIRRSNESMSVSLSVNRSWQQSRFSLSIANDVQATGNGLEYENKSLSLSLSKSVLKNLSLTSSSIYSEQQALGESLPGFVFRDRDYSQQSLRFVYSPSRRINISSHINYVEYRYDGVRDVYRAVSGGIGIKLSTDFHRR